MSTRSGKRSSRKKLKTEVVVTDSHTCRVCLESTPADVAVFLFAGPVAFADGKNLAEVISLLGDIAVAVEDDEMLPKWCCQRCHAKLDEAYQLRIQCQESDRKLRGFAPVKTESVVMEEPVFKEEEMDIPVDMFIPEDTKPQLDEISELVVEMFTPQEEDSPIDSGNDAASSIDAEEDKVTEKTDTQPQKKPSRALAQFVDVYEEVPATKGKCCGCKLLFDTRTELQAHLEAVHYRDKPSDSHVPRKDYVFCEVCFKHMHRRNVYKHRMIGTTNFRCKTCGEIFPTRKQVCMHHQHLHMNFPLKESATFKCCCNQEFDTTAALRQHSDQEHLPNKPPPDPDRPFSCDLCFINLKSYSCLYAHRNKKQRSTIKRFQCSQCGRFLMTPLELKRHEFTHKNESAFRCDQCPKAFTHPATLRKHVYRVHKVPHDRYKCTQCGKGYKDKKNYSEHMVVAHSGERPYLCTLCPATFAREGNLGVHMKSHVGDRKYTCPQCGKGFVTGNERNKHVRLVHQAERPFPCFYCERKYPRKDYRKRHMVSAHPAELLANPPPQIELEGRNWAEQRS